MFHNKGFHPSLPPLTRPSSPLQQCSTTRRCCSRPLSPSACQRGSSYSWVKKCFVLMITDWFPHLMMMRMRMTIMNIPAMELAMRTIVVFVSTSGDKIICELENPSVILVRLPESKQIDLLQTNWCSLKLHGKSFHPVWPVLLPSKYTQFSPSPSRPKELSGCCVLPFIKAQFSNLHGLQSVQVQLPSSAWSVAPIQMRVLSCVQ